METKLTLKLDKGIIESAKRYAERNKKSLSKLVEDYFRNLVSENKAPPEYHPLIEQLSGIISENDLQNLSADDDRANYILRKGR